MVLGILIPIVRLLIVIPFIVLTASAVACLGLTILFSDMAVPAMTSNLLNKAYDGPIWVILFAITIIYGLGSIILAFAMAPLILLLGIYDEICKQTHQMRQSEPLLLNQKAKATRAKTETQREERASHIN